MEKVNIYAAKTNLSKIVHEVARTGEPVVIAKNGHALVKVIAYREEKPKRKLGFMLDQGNVSDSFLDNFDDMNAIEIQGMFAGKNV
ncbi:type II toxin-antitoxin system Phd/YefM family antitoxin [Brenneria populi subsp. brevivirga]|uniref:type II toxin-antitoxin system Phd/YefM family antitoxin n=1 Tax=Brenneria populi TaxID=1505588 RepID=UPI002E18AC3B|nr:type II toxin-antitoxin system Phd/YefM family antitoxin [Brenneria populi subsp. brevivirga]